MPLSRRVILTLSATIAAATAAMVPSYGDTYTFAGDERYLPNPKLPSISFKGARESLDAAVKLVIDTSQRDFDIKYTDAQRDLIRAKLWNAAQLELNKFYQPKEVPNGG
jgi:hypothetical protein